MCEALAAKHVIRVCSAGENDRVADAARRLLENAPLIRQSVDLSGAHPLLGTWHTAAYSSSTWAPAVKAGSANALRVYYS